MKEFQITYNGSKVPVEINDKPTAGFCLKVSKPPIMKYKTGQALPELDIEEYLMLVATNLITKAPWQLQSPDAIRALPKDTFFELCDIIGNEFPLQDFLYPVAKLTYGKQFSLAESPSQTEYTLNSPSGESPPSK